MQISNPCQPRRLRFCGPAALALSLALALPVEAACPEALLPPENWPDSMAAGINNRSEVTGSVGDYDYGKLEIEIGAVWDGRGRILRLLQPLPLGGHLHAAGLDINKHGVVAGVSGEFYGVYDPVPVLWDAEGQVTALPLLPGHENGSASAINDAGQAVGYSRDDSGTATQVPVFWDGSGTVHALVLPPGGGPGSRAIDINNRGETVGETNSHSGAIAVKWDSGGTPSYLPPLPGFSRSIANAINRFGIVVGTSSGNSESTSLATKWNTRGKIKVLRPLPGDDSSIATGINRYGVALGTSIGGSGSERVFTVVTWDRKGNPTPHRSFRSFDGVTAAKINNKGEFIGRHFRTDDLDLDKYTSMATIWY